MRFVGHTDNLTTLGIEDAAGAMTTIAFPNPSAGDNINVIISGATVNECSYFVTSVTGRQVLSGRLKPKVRGPLDVALF